MQNMNTIYGINLNEEITPKMVRDAIIECYYQADSEVLKELFQQSDFNSREDEEKSKREHVEIMIKKFFDDVDGDFNNPTKESLIKVINRCRDFAQLFRDRSIIDSNYQQIFTLIERIQ